MIKNYLKIAIRLIWKNKTYVAINLLSLGFALACCILSYLHYDYRQSFDKTHVNTEDIYRLNSVRDVNGSAERWGISPAPIAASVIKDLPGISRIARLHSAGFVVKKGENVFNETVHFADKNIFSFFTFPLVAGNHAQFDSQNTVVVSETFAAKYFGKQSAVGKEITIVDNDKENSFTVIGVVKTQPLNSSFQFDLITSFDNAIAGGQTVLNDWRQAPMITTFAEIKNKATVASLAKGLDHYVPIQNESQKDWKVKGFYFQPFKEIALSSDIDFSEYVQGRALNPNPRGVMVFVPAIMSLFILLITCCNFTNISIAFASKRLKEIGVRKVMGGRKKQLIKQFFVENILLCLIASLLAICIVFSLLPVFKTWTGVALNFDIIENPTLLFFLLALPVLTAILAGIYPSFYISSFEPIGILKGHTTFGPKSRFTRFLLLIQFSLSSLALVIGMVLTKNASYQEKVDFGYAINEVIVTEVNNAQEYIAVRNALSSNTKIKSIAGAAQQIGAGTYTAVAATDKSEVNVQVAAIGGEDYLKTMGVSLLQGRHFHRGESLDPNSSIIVNQTFVEQLGLSPALGRRIKLDSNFYTITGVVADYKERGLHGKVPPCVLRAATENDFKYLVVRAHEQDLTGVAALVRSAWYKEVPGKPYRGFLQSDVIEKERYMNIGLQAVSFFLAIVVILLSAAGLFALVSLNIIRRSKEVGMRKVLGATVMNLMSLVSKDFLVIVLVAFSVGAALAYVIIDKIIFQHIYVYNPGIGIGAFVSALAVILFSCCVTVGWRVYGAASENPVHVLRKD